MREKRVFSNQIVGSDAFMGLPAAAQALYFQLCMNADDDGFIGAASKIISSVGLSRKELNLLSDKGFVILFDSGVCVIRHWRLNNAIRKDRYKPTIFDEEFSMLEIRKNGAYSLLVDQIATELQPDCNQVATNNKKAPIRRESLDSFFDSVWKLYPIKKGKGKVSKAQKQKLQKLGYDQLKRCVDRFIEDMEKEHRDKQYWPYGSTFFNSGYVDYLDENCDKKENPQPEVPEDESVENIDRFGNLPENIREEFERKNIIESGSDSINFGFADEEDMRLMKEYGLL